MIQLKPVNCLRLALFLALIWTGLPARAAYLSRPELVDYNFASANICEKAQLRIKFDHENFNAGNLFTVEVSQNGAFGTGNTYTLIGNLSQSGNQQNVFMTLTFPANIPAGNNYRLRVRGSNPITYSSQLNEFPFSISKLSPSDPNFYPENRWRGYFYTWTPSITGTILDANNEDIFNPLNYKGYIVEDSLSFEYNWGNNTNAPGVLPDSNKVCGSYRDFFAIRMRRRINFEEGYYLLGGGADDGFRLSLDGGLTWIINDWSDHSYRGTVQNNGCGVFLTAGVRDVVAEFYENKTDAQFRLILQKTGDPAVNPISIVSPLNGATICAGSGLVPLVGNPAGGWQWSGPGVLNRGWLNPSVGGTGPRTITYQTGINAFGSNCVKTVSITVNIVPGLSADFSGLQPSYCINSPAVTLSPTNAGGAFAGPGVSGATFNPALAGLGPHTVSYALNSGSGCQDTVRKQVTVFALPDAGFNDLPDTVCEGSANLVLVPNTPGGSFIGQGVIPPNQFSPGILLVNNTYMVEYRVTQNGCSNRSEQFVNILDKLKPTLSFPTLKTRYCQTEAAFQPQSDPPAQYYLNGTLVTSIDPAALAPGNYSLLAVFTPDTPLSCIDTASARFPFVVIANPTPDLGADQEVESGNSVSLDPKVNGTWQWTVSEPGVSAADNAVLTFNPTQNQTVSVVAKDPTGTCSGQDEVAITVREKIEFPNLFTPNGDGFNNEWRIKGAYPGMKVQIFNRWGKKVHDGTTDGELAWKGEDGGKSGLYFFLVEHPTDGRTWNGWLKVEGKE